MKRSKARAGSAAAKNEAVLRKFALVYPEAHEEFPWGEGAPEVVGFFQAYGRVIDNFQSGLPPLAPLGDFDGDGDIDGADFLIWQNNFPNSDGGQISFSGDSDGDGDVDGADFLNWQNNFPTPASSLSAVPEPATAALLALAGSAWLLRRRRAA